MLLRPWRSLRAASCYSRQDRLWLVRRTRAVILSSTQWHRHLQLDRSVGHERVRDRRLGAALPGGYRNLDRRYGRSVVNHDRAVDPESVHLRLRDRRGDCHRSDGRGYLDFAAGTGGIPLPPRAVSVFVVPGVQADFLTDNAVPHGQVSTVYYSSRVTGAERRMEAYTPPGYGRGHQDYPTL